LRSRVNPRPKSSSSVASSSSSSSSVGGKKEAAKEEQKIDASRDVYYSWGIEGIRSDHAPFAQSRSLTFPPPSSTVPFVPTTAASFSVVGGAVLCTRNVPLPHAHYSTQTKQTQEQNCLTIRELVVEEVVAIDAESIDGTSHNINLNSSISDSSNININTNNSRSFIVRAINNEMSYSNPTSDIFSTTRPRIIGVAGSISTVVVSFEI
jgi:hypothetical protein